MVYPELAHLGLVVSRGGEDLRLLGGDGGVAVDEAREDAAQGMGKRALVAGGNAPSAACCWRRLAALPPGIRHIVLVPTVPVVFPKLPLSEGILQTIDGSRLIKGALQKTGLASHILDRHAAISATCDTHTLAAQCPHVGLAVHAQRMGGGTG